VDSKAPSHFKTNVEKLGRCFPNVFVMEVSNVSYYYIGVLDAVYKCLRYLTELKHDWKYYQYLSGVDLPLKTNLEMVRIFKRLNGTMNSDVIRHDPGRTYMATTSSPLPLWKSSLSALVPRQAADAIVASDVTRQLIQFLRPTECPDETFWATIAGNPQLLQIPGGFDAAQVYWKILLETEQRQELEKQKNVPKFLPLAKRTPEEPFELSNFYISRYQVWKVDRLPCRGRYNKDSCVYGLGDFNELILRPELVAHKFYMEFQPAAYICVYRAIRGRALDKESQRRFQGRVYENLPLVRITSGAQISEVDFHINTSFPNFHFSR